MNSTSLRRMASRWVVAACALPAITLPAITLPAQGTPLDSAKKKAQPVFTINDAAITVGFVGLTFALYPADKSMAQRLQNQHAVASKAIDHWATGFDYLALPGVYVLGAGAYAAGRLMRHPDMADVGWHVTEASIAGAALTEIFKGIAGRARPYVSLDTNPRDWKVGSGFTSGARQSFPSGHTTIAFAAAAAASSEVNRLWPRYAWLAGTLLYGSASMVGLARMYNNQHWASDVVLGAGIGTLTGLKTVRYSHLHPDNYLDRVLLHTTVGPAPGGGRISWSAPFR